MVETSSTGRSQDSPCGWTTPGPICGILGGVSSSTERRKAARTLALVWVVLVLAVLAVGWLLTGPLASSVDPWDDSVVRWLEERRTPDLDTAAAAGSAIADTIVGVGIAALVGIAGSWWQRSSC